MTSLWRSILAGIAWVEGQPVEIDNFLEPARINFDLLANCDIQKNVPAGGDEFVGIDATASGDKRLVNFHPLWFNNTSARWSGTAGTLIARFRFHLRVSDPAINITPIVWYADDEETLLSSPSVAAITGEVACSATDADLSGSDQIQSVDITIPSGEKVWMAGVTIGGTPAAGLQVWARAWRDIYIAS